MMEQNEKSAQDYYLYAQDALKQGDWINGIARLTKAVALNDDYAEARLLRARILLEMGDVNGAGEDVRWLTEHVPQLLSDVSGDFSAEGVERCTRQGRSNLNPFGL